MNHNKPKSTGEKREKFTLRRLGAGISETIQKTDSWLDSQIDPLGHEAAVAEAKKVQDMHIRGHTRLTTLEGVQSKDPSDFKQTTRYARPIDSEK